MATLSGSEALEVVWAQGDGAAGAPSSAKTHLVFWGGSVEDLGGSAGGAMTTSACCPRYVIRGRLVAEAGTSADPGLVGFTVELWESGASWALPRASVVTGDNGEFSVTLDDTAFATATRTITFKVFEPGGAAVTPDPPESWTPASLDQQILVHVLGLTSAVRTHVGGFVRTRDGTPASGLTVRALSKKMRSEDVVGQSTTNTDGRYELDCTTTETKFDLIVVAGTGGIGGGGFTEQARSALVRDVSSVVEVDLVVGNVALVARSEFQTIMDAINAARGSVLASDLTVDDVATVAGKYGLRTALVQLAVDANKAALLAGSGLLPELFYAIGHARQTVTLQLALAVSADDRAAAVDGALAALLVPAAFGAVSSAQLATLNGLVPTLLLTDPTTSLETRLSVILRIAGISSSTDRQALFAAYASYTDSPEQFWIDAPTLTGIAGNPTLIAALPDARAALDIGIYTLNHPPLVQSLWSSGIRSASDLAKLTATEWTTRINSTVTLPGGSPMTVGTPVEIIGANSTVKAANYSQAMVVVASKAYPSSAFVAAYGGNPISGTTPLATFFAANPTFDFAQESISQYVRDNPTAFNGNPTGQPLVEKLARLFKVVPEDGRYNNAKALWDGGFDSARSIFLSGKQSFITKMTGGPYAWSGPLASQVFDKATQINAMCGSIAMQFGIAFQGFGQGGAVSTAGVSSPPSSIPDWAALFGGLDYCQCEDCLSVLSPAAYLTDLLHFLKTRPQVPNPLAQLVLRRPDLTNIELSCPNTNTVLPYIDIANERLELEVSPASVAPYQTTRSAEELAVHPEHLHVPAYDKLAGT
jgi:hypothetical protein